MCYTILFSRDFLQHFSDAYLRRPKCEECTTTVEKLNLLSHRGHYDVQYCHNNAARHVRLDSVKRFFFSRFLSHHFMFLHNNAWRVYKVISSMLVLFVCLNYAYYIQILIIVICKYTWTPYFWILRISCAT